MKSVVLFFDTNKLFSFVRSWKSGSTSWKTHEIYHLSQEFTVVVSTFVLLELQRVLFRKIGLSVDVRELQEVCNQSAITIIGSDMIEEGFYHFVYDPMDAQILSDAYHAHAQYLITANIKDFDIHEIKEKLNITIVKNL